MGALLSRMLKALRAFGAWLARVEWEHSYSTVVMLPQECPRCGWTSPEEVLGRYKNKGESNGAVSIPVALTEGGPVPDRVG